MSRMIVCPECGAKNNIPKEKQHLVPKCGRCGQSLAAVPVSGVVNTLTDGGFRQWVELSTLPVLVDFFSPTCGPCRMIAPVIESLAEAYAGRLLVFQIDTSSQQMTAAKYQIRGVPTLLLFKDGRMADQLVGAVSRAEIETRINALVH